MKAVAEYQKSIRAAKAKLRRARQARHIVYHLDLARHVEAVPVSDGWWRYYPYSSHPVGILVEASALVVGSQA